MPVFHMTADRVIVQLYYYCGVNHLTKLNTTNTAGPSAGFQMNGTFNTSAHTTKGLCTAISQLFSEKSNAAVPVELRVVRLQQPYLNSYILAQYLATNASVFGFTRLRQSLLSAIPLGLSFHVPGLTSFSIIGVKVQVSGLLTTQRNAPRKTVSTVSTGTFHGTNTIVEYASNTTKSSLGAYTVKV